LPRIGSVRGEVEDPRRLDRSDRCFHAIGIGQIGFVQADPIEYRLDTPSGEAGPHQQVRLMSVGDEAVGQISPDEACAARQDDPFHPS
jgi:hypothetical protein